MVVAAGEILFAVCLFDRIYLEFHLRYLIYRNVLVECDDFSCRNGGKKVQKSKNEGLSLSRIVLCLFQSRLIQTI
jgi:hypothetical protein